jgi:hypothetical protein
VLGGVVDGGGETTGSGATQARGKDRERCRTETGAAALASLYLEHRIFFGGGGFEVWVFFFVSGGGEAAILKQRETSKKEKEGKKSLLFLGVMVGVGEEILADCPVVVVGGRLYPGDGGESLDGG